MEIIFYIFLCLILVIAVLMMGIFTFLNSFFIICSIIGFAFIVKNTSKAKGKKGYIIGGVIGLLFSLATIHVTRQNNDCYQTPADPGSLFSMICDSLKDQGM
ncbi:TPA: hypothetical protein ACF5HI_004094 [Salmonella enterica]